MWRIARAFHSNMLIPNERRLNQCWLTVLECAAI